MSLIEILFSSETKKIMLDIKPYFEFLYYIFSLAVPVVGFIALKQISIAKKDIELRTTRESIALALQQYDKYVENILPDYNNLFKILNDKNFSFYKNKVNGFDECNFNGAAKLWYEDFSDLFSENKIIQEDIIKLSNKLEQFSIVFVQAKANKDTVFSSIGNNYCKMVVSLYPVILSLRAVSVQNPPYDNIIKLYNEWSVNL